MIFIPDVSESQQSIGVKISRTRASNHLHYWCTVNAEMALQLQNELSSLFQSRASTCLYISLSGMSVQVLGRKFLPWQAHRSRPANDGHGRQQLSIAFSVHIIDCDFLNCFVWLWQWTSLPHAVYEILNAISFCSSNKITNRRLVGVSRRESHVRLSSIRTSIDSDTGFHLKD